MGSAYGGEWRPSPDKPDDRRFIGKPNSKTEWKLKNGEKVTIRYDENGRAIAERHWSDHNRGHSGHTAPHDHLIDWSRGFPYFDKNATQYPDGNVPSFEEIYTNGGNK